MNVWLVRAALRTRGLSPGAFRVLLVHANACPPSGRTCLPGLEELAEACELSPQHVLRLRAQLVAAGHLRRLAAARPGQRPVYEVLPAVPIPVPSGERTTEPQQPAVSPRMGAGNGSHECDPPYKTQGVYPPTPQVIAAPAGGAATEGGRGILDRPRPEPGSRSSDMARPSRSESSPLAAAAIAALRPEQRTRLDELGLRRLEWAAVPLVEGWTPSDVGRRIGAERLDRAENLAAVLCAVLRRYALEPSPKELRAAERAAYQRRACSPPPEPCAHGDPGGCTACSFCRRGLADPGGERCRRCAPSVPSVPIPKVVSA